jgi:hypothetical protein
MDINMLRLESPAASRNHRGGEVKTRLTIAVNRRDDATIMRVAEAAHHGEMSAESNRLKMKETLARARASP